MFGNQCLVGEKVPTIIANISHDASQVRRVELNNDLAVYGSFIKFAVSHNIPTSLPSTHSRVFQVPNMSEQHTNGIVLPLSSLHKLVKKLAGQGPFKLLETPKRIRLLYNGAMIADTTKAMYVWEHEYYPQYYLPMESFVRPEGFDVKISHGEAIKDDGGKIVGGGLELAVRRRNSNDDFRVLNDMVLFAADLEGPATPLRNHVKVMFNAVGS